MGLSEIVGYYRLLSILTYSLVISIYTLFIFILNFFLTIPEFIHDYTTWLFRYKVN